MGMNFEKEVETKSNHRIETIKEKEEREIFNALKGE